MFKIVLLAFKALYGMAPMYISELLDRYVPLRPLRSSSRGQLRVPRSKTKYGATDHFPHVHQHFGMII